MCAAEVVAQVQVPGYGVLAKELVMDKVYALVAEYLRDTQAKNLYEAGINPFRKADGSRYTPAAAAAQRLANIFPFDF